MITTRVIPQAAASATSQELLVEITEQTCRPYCVNSTVKPTASVSFSAGTVKTLNGNAIVPITAFVTVVSPNTNGCGCAHSQVFSETFDVAFEATTANSITLTPGTSSLTSPANVKCCKARAVELVTSLTISIA